MYGKDVTLVLKNTEGVVTDVVTVFVCGMPDLSDAEWERRAKAKINGMKIHV